MISKWEWRPTLFESTIDERDDDLQAASLWSFGTGPARVTIESLE